MAGQMCWLPPRGTTGENILHLRLSPNQSWEPYTNFNNYKVPDYDIPGGSKGWATYQKLIRSGWTLVKTSQASHFAVTANLVAK